MLKTRVSFIFFFCLFEEVERSEAQPRHLLLGRVKHHGGHCCAYFISLVWIAGFSDLEALFLRYNLIYLQDLIITMVNEFDYVS